MSENNRVAITFIVCISIVSSILIVCFFNFLKNKSRNSKSVLGELELWLIERVSDNSYTTSYRYNLKEVLDKIRELRG